MPICPPERDESISLLADDWLEHAIHLQDDPQHRHREGARSLAKSYQDRTAKFLSPLASASWIARYLRRHIRSPVIRLLWLLAKLYLLTCLTLILLATVFFPSHTNPPPAYKIVQERCAGPSPRPGCANPHHEKVFIVASLYDKHGKLLSGRWGEQLLNLVHLLDSDNVFVSIYENNSAPEGIAALDAMRDRLPCRNALVHEATVDTTGFPTVTMPDGTKRMKRLAYLTELRNRAMWPLDRYNETLGSFDKILYLNDIYYRPIDAAQLLFSTNADHTGRTHYLSACALDFTSPSLFYDSYALRDAEGYPPGSQEFPIFTAEGSGISRRDMLGDTDAVRVSSCWSGMVAMQANWVQNTVSASLPSPDFQKIAKHVINPDAPEPVKAPVRFRYEPEIYTDSCECCLFLADVTTVARNAGDPDTDTFVNPYVRVTYRPGLLSWVLFNQRWERLWIAWQAYSTWARNLPEQNAHRTVKEGDLFTEEIWVSNKSRSAGGSWEMRERKGRNGMFCWGRKMHLIQTKGRRGEVNWVKARVPKGHLQ